MTRSSSIALHSHNARRIPAGMRTSRPVHFAIARSRIRRRLACQSFSATSSGSPKARTAASSALRLVLPVGAGGGDGILKVRAELAGDFGLQFCVGPETVRRRLD